MPNALVLFLKILQEERQRAWKKHSNDDCKLLLPFYSLFSSFWLSYQSLFKKVLANGGPKHFFKKTLIYNSGIILKVFIDWKTLEDFQEMNFQECSFIKNYI